MEVCSVLPTLQVYLTNKWSSFSYGSFATTFTKEFERPDGIHKVKIDIYEENNGDIKNSKITASEYVNDKKIWSLVDYVNDCPLDINMALINDSFEIKKINDSFDAVMFSYTIGCVGGLNPVTVKYFAYENGMKHSLRGEERMVTPDGVTDDNVKPVPDANLKKMPYCINICKVTGIKRLQLFLNNFL